MDLFKSNKSFKEKVHSDSNWKTEWFQSDIYFLRLSPGRSFVGNNLNF